MTIDHVTYQRVLAELVVDSALFAGFAKDPQQALTDFELDLPTRDVLLRIDPRELRTFREVVLGTRAIRFSSVFGHVAAQVGEAWPDLLRRFDTEVVIRDSTEHRDALAFSSWLDGTFPGSGLGDLGRYDLAMVKVGTERRGPISPGHLRLAPTCEPFTTGHDLTVLLDEGCAEDAVELGSQHYYALLLDPDTQDVQVIELQHEVHAVLMALTEARREECLATVTGLPTALVGQIVEECRDAGLIH